ncbi:MAG: phosphoribosylformylglycinamidine synthase [Deltaproteobacteria bacterium]|nr:MAG: phosphoribosylformylglycinamidine synthase [Deltaproteobacteria bacterium]
MAKRVEVAVNPDLRDSRGEGCVREIEEFLHIPLDGVRTLDAFTLDFEVGEGELSALAKEVFSDPVVQVSSTSGKLGAELYPAFEWLLEVGYLPGVTDNEGRTAKEAVEMFLERSLPHQEKVYTSVQYLIKGNSLDRETVEKIASGLLANPLIQRWRILSRKEYDASGGVSPEVPRVTGVSQPVVNEIDLEVSDDELLEISRRGLLALTVGEMQAVRDFYREEQNQAKRAALGLPADRPTDVELECLAQTWSEHCKHKIFNATINYEDEGGEVEVITSIFKTYVQGATKKVREDLGEDDYCLSVFIDNAGVIAFDDDYSLCFKVETHNSPSALDPYGGALTGIVGVNRDPMGTGMGSQLIFNVDTFCFANPFHEEELPPRLLHPRRIYEGVVTGVEHGGNKSGIPTVNGTVYFDDRFLGKPLVFCGTAGLIPRTLNGGPGHNKRTKAGDLVVMAGGRIGKDGIHGATFSSEELHEGSPATAVQLGDPITQKRLYDFLLIARDRGLYSSITDNGAGGLSSSIGEMAEQTGGALLHLDRAPLKYPGLHPWEILVSESQERMSIAVPEDNIEEFMTLAEKMRVEAVVMGEFTDEGAFHLLYDGKTVGYLPLEFLHDGLPPMLLNAKWTPPVHEEPSFECPAELTDELKALLGRLNICSKESIVRRYDHEVQGGSVVKPFVGAQNDGPSDAAVNRPILDSFEGVVTANGISPRYSDIDAYWMTALVVDEAIRNAVAVGGTLDHLAGLDNFCWCDPVESEKTPDGRYKLAQLVRSSKALYEYTTAYGVPLVSGKDSMKNDYSIGGTKISIPPTLLFSVIGKVPDIRKSVTMDAKRVGDLIYILGKTYPELGGSEYWAAKGFTGNSVPKVDAGVNKKLYRALEAAIQGGLVASCHDCSDGGLGVAIAESVFSGDLGGLVDLSKAPMEGIARNDELLFSESAGRFVVTVSPKDKAAFEAALEGSPFALVGEVAEESSLVVDGMGGARIVEAEVGSLKDAWQTPLAAL